MKSKLFSLTILSACFWTSSLLMAAEASIVTKSETQARAEELLAPIPADNSDLSVPSVPPLATNGNAIIENCASKVKATKFNVVGLFRCGERVRATGLIGAWNRRPRACNTKGIIAEVFTTKNTCDDCQTRSAARQIRIDRRFGSACECPEYIQALAQDLGSSSWRMRVAATRSLRVCGFEVEEYEVCVEQPLPYVVMYL